MFKLNIKEGDLVLLVDESYFCGQWLIVCVEEVVVSRDGYVCII